MTGRLLWTLPLTIFSLNGPVAAQETIGPANPFGFRACGPEAKEQTTCYCETGEEPSPRSRACPDGPPLRISPIPPPMQTQPTIPPPAPPPVRIVPAPPPIRTQPTIPPPAPPPARTAPVVTDTGEVDRQSALGKRFEEIISYDARKWRFNRYERGTLHQIDYVNYLNDFNFQLRGYYYYHQLGVRKRGWALLKVSDGKLDCIEYWDAVCRRPWLSEDSPNFSRMPDEGR